jgi:hypothetical protein
MADKTTKILLALIALGVWANLYFLYQPVSQVGDAAETLFGIESKLESIGKSVDQIQSDVNDIGDGTCTNSFVCR